MCTHMSTNAKAVWAAAVEIVGMEDMPFKANQNLFELGLDSLGLAELVIQLEEGTLSHSEPITFASLVMTVV